MQGTRAAGGGGADLPRRVRPARREDVRALDTPDRDKVDGAENLAALARATGVYVTGGNQQLLVQRLRDTKVDRHLHERHLDGVVIGGTSAGASMAGALMLNEGRAKTAPRAGMVELGPGLDFLPGVVVAPHFSPRGRLGRLLTVLASRPHSVAVGLDTNTALVVTGGDGGEVIGEGVVTILDTGRMSHNSSGGRQRGEPLALFDITLHTLPSGCRYDFRLRRPAGAGDTNKAASQTK